MQISEFETIVIGSGIVGLSTAVEAAYHIPSRVACIDAHGVANPLGASGDGLRLFRLSYFEHSSYVPLLREAIEAWRSLDEDLYVPVGGLYAGPADSVLVTGSLESALEHEIQYEILTSAQVRSRYPQFDLPNEFVGFLEADGGYIRAAKATRAMAAKAERLGVQVIVDQAFSISPIGHRWEVSTANGLYFCDRLIVAAGAATVDLVPSLRRYLDREPHLVAWFDSPDWKDLPGFGIMNEEEEMLYGFPAVDDVPGVKVGGHHRFSSESLSQQERGLCELTQRFLPTLSKSVCHRRTCDYDSSPDGHFIIGELEPGLTVACGFSGHGFKFGSIIGRVILDSTVEFEDDLSFLDVARFTSTSGLT